MTSGNKTSRLVNDSSYDNLAQRDKKKKTTYDIQGRNIVIVNHSG